MSIKRFDVESFLKQKMVRFQQKPDYIFVVIISFDNVFLKVTQNIVEVS